MQHLIKKQIITLHVPAGIQPFGLQQNVRDFYMQKILPVLEQVFDELSDEEETILIDNLQIDLGSISSYDISLSKWPEEILSGLREQLIEKIIRKKANPESHKPKSINAAAQWLYYMEKGYLPWNALHIHDEWYRQVLEALATDYTMVSDLRTLIRNNQEASKRIVLQHSESFLVKLTETLTAEKQSELPAIIAELQKLLQGPGRLPSFSSIDPAGSQRNIWQQMIISASEQGRNTSSQQLAETVITFFVPDINMLDEMVTNPSAELKRIFPILKRLQKSPGKFSKKPLPSEPKESAGEKQDIAIPDQIDEAGVFVQNAGVVLLHAFLPTLLNRLQWVSERKFKNQTVHQKALCLIHYIATGETTAAEHELTVAKILCGWPLNKTIDREVELAPSALKEAENMMHAAVARWTVLKTTSIEGLREGFLRRGGKLCSKNDRLILQVEGSSIDVLLDQLPWNLNIIKLPWMREILRVEWR